MSYPKNINILTTSGGAPSSEVYFGSYSGGYKITLSSSEVIKVGLISYKIVLFARDYQSYSNLLLSYRGKSYSPSKTQEGTLTRLEYNIPIVNRDHVTSSFDITLFNSSHYPFYLLTQNYSSSYYRPKLYLNNESFLTYPKSDGIRPFSFGNGFFEFNFNYFLGTGLFSKKLFDGLLPYSLTFNIDPLNLVYRLSLDQHLDLSEFVLTNGKIRNTYFIESRNDSNYLIDKEGTGLVLERDYDYSSSGTYYKIHHILDPIKKEVFDSNGNFVAFIDTHGNINHVSISGTSVTITDYRNNVVTYSSIAYGSTGIVFQIKLNNVLFYEFRDELINSQSVFTFIEYEDNVAFKTITFTSQYTEYIKKVECNGEILNLTYSYPLEKYYVLDFIPSGSGMTHYENLSISYLDLIDEYLNPIIQTTITNLKGISYIYLSDKDYRLINESEDVNNTSITLLSKRENDISNISSSITCHHGDIRNVVNTSFANQFSITTTNSNPIQSVGPSIVCYFNEGPTFGNGNHFQVEFYLESSTLISDEIDNYVSLDASFHNSFNNSSISQFLTFHLLPSTMNNGTKTYVARMIVSTEAQDSFDYLTLSMEVHNPIGIFTLKRIYYERIYTFEQNYYLDDYGYLYPLSTYTYGIKYKPTGSNNYTFLSADLTKEDLIINQILMMRGIKTLFYNGLKNVIHGFQTASYLFRPANNQYIFLDDFTFVAKSVNNSKIRYSYLKAGTVNNETFIFGYTDKVFGTHLSMNKYKLNDFVLLQANDELGLVTSYSYDSNNYVTAESNNVNQSISYSYETGGKKRVSSIISSESGTTTYGYKDNLDLLTSFTNSGVTTTYGYTSSTNINYLSSITKSNSINHIDFDGNSSFNVNSFLNTSNHGFAFEYDIYNKLTEISLNETPIYQISNSIDDSGDSVTVSLGSYSYTDSFDIYGRLLTRKEGTTTKISNVYMSRVYDPVGDYVIYEDTPIYSASILRYSFDYYLSESMLIEYDDDYQVSEIIIYDGIVDFDNLDNPTTLYVKDIYYDDLYRITSEEITSYSSSKHIALTLDKEYSYYLETSLISSCSITLNNETIEDIITYDSLARISEYKIQDGSAFYKRNYTYGSQSISIVSSFSSALSSLTESISKDYRGNILSHSKTGLLTESVSYQYDDNNRLVKEINGTKEIRYYYDYNGNITSVETYVNNVLSSSDTYSYDSNYSDKLISFNGNAIAYNSCLNPTSFGTKTYSYTKGRLLEKYQTSSTKYCEYFYNKDGIRYKKVRYLKKRNKFQQVESTIYQIENNRIIAEARTNLTTSVTKTLYYYYGISGIEGFLYNGNKYLYLKDATNTILGILNSSLALSVRYSYDAYGGVKTLNPDGTVNTSSTFIGNINPFRYKGYYYDSESGMYYCESRYYIPELRRWLTHDDFSYLDEKTIDGLNLYAYCLNNPVKYSDESGAAPIATWIGYIIGMAFYPIFRQNGVTVFSYIGACIDSIYDENVRSGMNAVNWNPFCSDNNAVYNAIKNGSSVSFFMGAPVIATNNGRSGSFGAIFFKTSELSATMLNHEYGHVSQLQYLGILLYLINAFIPSAIKLGVNESESNYYFKPWESSASLLGGDWGRGYTYQDILISASYLLASKFGIPILAWLFALYGW